MSVTVLYFASLKEITGRSQDIIALPEARPAYKIWDMLNPELTIPENTLTAINMEYVQATDLVKDNDELAFFPPVTGGAK